MRNVFWLALLLALAAAPTREEKVRSDRERVESEGFWIYNDLARGFDEAKRTGKPLVVTLRCIPCEECVKLDEDLVNQDPRVRPLLEEFVRVRIVGTNGLDLSLFQFDYDQSFAVFFLNADGTIYGRFGTRSHRTEWSDDVSIEGLARALEGALELHREFPGNEAILAAKKGPQPEAPTPEQIPGLKGQYAAKLDYEGQVVKSCIHCHQIGDALREAHRQRREPVPEEVLFSYPHPKIVGMILDPKQRATVERVEKSSPADEAGFMPGDEILMLDRQPLLSIADVQWVLHRASPEGASLAAKVRRGGQLRELTLTLPPWWRRRDDLSWRSTSWGLRRMASGGLVLESLAKDARQEASLSQTDMALAVKHVGQYGPHAAAKSAGFRQGDILVSFDGRTDLARETDLLAYAVTHRQPGDQVPVTILRNGKRIELTLPMQE
jgi:serine protease Do